MLIRIRNASTLRRPCASDEIEAVSTLFNGRKVETRGVGDRLNEIMICLNRYRSREWLCAGSQR